MALREKVTERVQPLLQPGDQVRHVFLTQTGMSPYSPLGGLIGTLIRKYWIVVVTDTQFVVCKASLFGTTKPKGVAYGEPRRVLAPEGKLWGKAVLGNDTHYIHRRFFKDIAAQDAELNQGSPTPPPPPPV